MKQTGKTLYITDLDGTLLNSGERLSDNTVRILNAFLDAGGLFSVATARNISSVHMLPLEGVHWNTPFVVGGGTMLYEYTGRRILDIVELSHEALRRIFELCSRYGKTPLLFQRQENSVRVTAAGLSSPGEKAFFDKRTALQPGCIQLVEDYELEKGGYFISMQDTREKMERLNRELSGIPGITCTLYRDNYLQDNWFLEIFSAQAGKDAGLLRLKKRLGVDRVVAFGDNFNDLPMLRAADVACVVENGVEEVKAAADVLLASNDADGVADYIKRVERVVC